MGQRVAQFTVDDVVHVDDRTRRRLDAIEQAYAELTKETGGPTLDRTAILEWVLSRGIAELSDELVAGTAFDLRGRHRDDRLRQRHGVLPRV